MKKAAPEGRLLNQFLKRLNQTVSFKKESGFKRLR